MKKAKLIIQESSISRVVDREFESLLSEKAIIIDAINEVDKMISGRESFPYRISQFTSHDLQSRYREPLRTGKNFQDLTNRQPVDFYSSSENWL